MNLSGATFAFDLDGTLVDSAPDLIGALNMVLGEQGLPHVALETERVLVGRGARALVERGFARAGRDLPDGAVGGLVARFIEIYHGRIAAESRPYPGVEATLDALAAEGVKLTVCTNKRTDLSLSLLDALDLTRRFAAVVGVDRAPAGKPDPRHVLAAIAEAGGDPNFAVMVGDSIFDIAAANAADVPSIAVSFGYTETPVAGLGALAVIDDFAAVPDAARKLLRDRSPALRTPQGRVIGSPP
ncbi:MAG: HAD-IA family hydrolase [Caulobacteraceae bacterium]